VAPRREGDLPAIADTSQAKRFSVLMPAYARHSRQFGVSLRQPRLPSALPYRSETNPFANKPENSPSRRPRLREGFPFFGSDMRLIENAAQGSDGHLVLVGHNCRVDNLAKPPHEFHVTALLADLDKACPFQAALDLAKGNRLKPPQPRPQLYALRADGWPEVARSAVRELLSGWPAPLLQSRPGWPHPLRGH
jgi:hypothetical protein